MRTYDYILAMKEQNQFAGLESVNDSDFSSDDSSEHNSPESSMSKFLCKEHRANGVRCIQPLLYSVIMRSHAFLNLLILLNF